MQGGFRPLVNPATDYAEAKAAAAKTVVKRFKFNEMLRTRNDHLNEEGIKRDNEILSIMFKLKGDK